MSIAGLSIIPTLAPLMAPLLSTLAGQPAGVSEALTIERSSIDRIEPALPTITVTRDDTRIDRSCIIQVSPLFPIIDDEGDGVIQIVADDVTVIFDTNSELVGREVPGQWSRRGLLDTLGNESPEETLGWDTLTGTGITINGHSGVEIIGANIRGYRNGIVAIDAPGLSITDATLTDLYRQRLKSTATREDTSDWLYPHHNDNNEWLANYGAAVWAERCHEAKITGVKVRRGQNGIILDNTNNAVVRKNDCSFLSGWGLAMWRSSGNFIRGNRFDFCVRGHVEGVYNRGQDSAGILMFEACSKNTIRYNSCTHSGDGIFGFGGNDAVKQGGDSPWGNAKNIIHINDLSFAAAHGLEMTFSEGNSIWNNLIEANAICGFWGGYSQGMSIGGNRFKDNGGMAYGSERGAINIEHGADNIIKLNQFINNKCGIRIWWDYDKALLNEPGVSARYKGVTGNEAYMNTFVFDGHHPFGDDAQLIGVELQDLGDAPDYAGPRVLEDALLVLNTFEINTPNAVESRTSDHVRLERKGNIPGFSGPVGPVGAVAPDRISPPGREWIICDQWGPWDFQTPQIREHSRSSSRHVYEIYPPVGSDMIPIASARAANTELVPPESDAGYEPWRLIITPKGDEPVTTYSVNVQLGTQPDEVSWSDARLNHAFSGRFINTTWAVRCWAWKMDPLTDIDAWRAEAADVQVTTLDELNLPFANSGPAHLNHALTVNDNDHFAIIAQTEIALPRGKWKLSTLSDDGIRVFINDEQVLERWDIHAPTPDEVVFEVNDDSPTRIQLEYFENSGYATLQLDLQPVE
ncbi:MAG: right-handed parallel beta-helix repeat-containing protein [Phycisphaerales bacterium JB052]